MTKDNKKSFWSASLFIIVIVLMVSMALTSLRTMPSEGAATRALHEQQKVVIHDVLEGDSVLRETTDHISFEHKEFALRFFSYGGLIWIFIFAPILGIRRLRRAGPDEVFWAGLAFTLIVLLVPSIWGTKVEHVDIHLKDSTLAHTTEFFWGVIKTERLYPIDEIHGFYIDNGSIDIDYYRLKIIVGCPAPESVTLVSVDHVDSRTRALFKMLSEHFAKRTQSETLTFKKLRKIKEGGC